MAADKGVAEAEEVQRRNVDPTIPFDGALPENMAGPFSNVELEIGDGKRSASLLNSDDETTRLRPQFARQAAKTGDAISDSDVLANPAADFEVGEDNGTEERQDRDEELGVAGLTSTPPKSSESAAKPTPASESAAKPAPAKSTPPARSAPAAKDK